MKFACFTPEIKTIGSFKYAGGDVLRALREEQSQMLHSASIEYTRQHGGFLANRFLDIIRKDILCPTTMYPVIDTKVVMLMPNQYACIPGWHCDAVPRDSVHSQPDPKKMDVDVKHFIGTLSSEENGAKTLFATSQYGLSYDPKNVWRSISEEITALGEEFSTKTVPNGGIVRISQPTLHTCQPAKTREMRFFFRLSYYRKPAENKRRHQVQVYTSFNNGW